ncbi:hypothetical protein TNCV_253961 [Trichonephila clavipes]|nr:hypothetical protein TNCV_253961 [Trichonephila clavipes]
MPLDNKCRIGPLAGAPPDTCAVVISTETESGFITEDDTSPVCHTPKLPEVGKKSVDTAYDVGSVVSVLADVGSSSQLRSVVSLWFLLMALDVWKEGLGSNPGEGMDVCKCTVPLPHEDTINSRQAASPLVSWRKGQISGRLLTTPRMFSLKIGMEPSQSILSPVG